MEKLSNIQRVALPDYLVSIEEDDCDYSQSLEEG